VEKKDVIPPTESHSEMVGMKVTKEEFYKIKAYCKANRITQSRLIRYAIKKYIPDL
jgi:hypothetical protein